MECLVGLLTAEHKGRILKYMESEMEIEGFTFPVLFVSTLLVKYATSQSNSPKRKILYGNTLMYALSPIQLIIYDIQDVIADINLI